MSNNAFVAGIRLYLAGDREAAQQSFMGESVERDNCRAACEAMAMWCRGDTGSGMDVVERFGEAACAGFIDLNYMPFLGLAADRTSRNRELDPLMRIALIQVAVDALRLSSELSGAVRRRVEATDGEVLAYRLAVAEHELPRLQRKFADDYRTYQRLQVEHLDLAKGRVETSLSILQGLLKTDGREAEAASSDAAQDLSNV